MLINNLLGSQLLIVLQCQIRKCKALSDSLPISLIFVTTQHHLEPFGMESNFDLGIVLSDSLLDNRMILFIIFSGF